MGLNEKIKNIQAIVRNDRKVWFLIVFIGIVVIMYSFSGGSPRKAKPPVTPTSETDRVKASGFDDGRAYKDLLATYSDEIDIIKKSTEQQRGVVDRLSTDINADRKQFQDIFETVADRLDGIDRNFETLEAKIKDLNGSGGGIMQYNEQTSTLAGLEAILWDPNDQGPPPVPPAPLKMKVVTPGDSVAVKLLSGVNAPVDGTPYPVLLQINSQIMGPDGSMLDIGEARIVASATGSETDSRVLFRLSDLAIRHNDGRRSVVKVDGWIVGEDGIRGMQGKLVDKLGRLIIATAGVSGTAALGTGLLSHTIEPKRNSYGDGNLVIESNDANYAMATALTDASNRLGQVLIDRYEKLVPVVEILSGREVAAVFSQPAEIEMMSEGDESIYDNSLD